jgi:hypothetical protein
MDARTLNVRTIFGQDRRHVVPLFQRPYVWKRESQWKPLWRDLRDVAERILHGEQVHAHFLGAVVLEHLRQPTGRVESRLVIDGQQRLTTIQLLLEAVSDLCAAHGMERYHKAMVKLTRNDDPLSDQADDQYKVWPTTVDQEHFRRVMRASSPDELLRSYGAVPGAREVGHHIADAYLYFFESARGWLNPGAGGMEDRLEALYQTVRDNLRMVVIDLDKDDDPQLIFETLNARGTPLLPSDLVKNHLFHRAQLAGDDIDVLYEKY